MTDTPAAPAPLVARAPERAGRRWVVARNGVSERVEPSDGAQVRAAARALGATPEEVRAALEAGRVVALEAERASAPATVAPIALEVRAWRRGAPGRETFASVEAALCSDYDLIDWHDGTPQRTRLLAALDVDVGEEGGYQPAEVEALMEAGPLWPRLGWVTKSGGVRLLFGADPSRGLAADEVAGLWALVTDALNDPRVAQVELKADTARIPPGRRPAQRTAAGVGDPLGWLAGTGGNEAVPPAARDRWLAERGLALDQREEHDRCPIDPSPGSRGSPVHVREDGIYCYRCAGVRGDGWRSWARLIHRPGDLRESRPRPPAAVEAAQECVHWTHAEIVLTALRPTCPPRLLRCGYAGLLRLLHPERDEETLARVAAVWRADLQLVRGLHGWLRASDLQPHDSATARTIGALPWVRGSGPRADLAEGTGPLDGYVPILPTAHLVTRPTWATHRSPTVVQVPRALPGVAPAGRMSAEDAWAAVRAASVGAPERWYALLRVLIVGALRAQLRPSVPPLVVVQGPSGSGKGAASEAAGGVLGSPLPELIFGGRLELDRSVGEGLERGALLLRCSEVGKVAHVWEHSGGLLSLCDAVTWRKLYSGSVTTPLTACVVLMGSTLPHGLATMTELYRRVSYVELPRVDPVVSGRWEGQVRATFGVDSWAAIRQRPYGAAVAAALVEEARAVALATASQPWPSTAEALGGGHLLEDDDARELRRTVEGLYALWRDPAGERCLVAPGERNAGLLRAWSEHPRNDPRDAAAELLSDWCDPEAPPHERRARLARFGTADAIALCNLAPESGVGLVVRQHGRRVAVGFRAPGDPPRTSYPAPVAS